MALLPLLNELREICGDGVVPLRSGSWGLHLSSTTGLDAAIAADVANRPKMPGVTEFYAKLGGSEEEMGILERFLGRQPPEALDRTVQTVPASSGVLSLGLLGEQADQVGLPVQAWIADLRRDEPGPALPLAQHRVIHLDRYGQMTQPEGGEQVRVVPLSSKAPRPYANVSDQVASIIEAQPYPPGRIVFTDDGIELGLPAGLVNHRYGATVHAHPVAVGIADLGGDFPQEAFDAVGAESVESLVGYVELLHRMQSSAPGTHGLVAVDRAAGAGTDAYLAIREPHGVSFLDLATLQPALFNKDPAGIRFAELPNNASSVLDRLDALDASLFDSRVNPSWPLYLPPGATVLPGVDTVDAGHAVVVIGPAGAEPSSVLDAAKGAAHAIDQPIIVLGVDRPGDLPESGRLATLRTLLNVYGWRGKVPVVVTRADVGPLTEVLDEYHASVVYQSPKGTGAVWPGGGVGGLVALNLGNPWVIRLPRGTEEPAAPGDRQPLPPPSDVLSPQLMKAAADRRRKPAFSPPSAPVASFLSVSLTNPAAVRETFRQHAPVLEGELPQVQQIVSRDPAFSGHHAVLSLAKLGQFDSAVAYLEAGDNRADAIVQPLLSVDQAAPPEERGKTIQTMLPHLAALAGGEINDRASEAILLAIGDLIAKRKSEDDVQADIRRYKDSLPKSGDVRVSWIRRLTALSAEVPQYEEILKAVGAAIMTCPD